MGGGTGVLFDNTFTGYAPQNSGFRLANDRSSRGYDPWGKCDGTSPFDGNQSPSGYPCLDQLGRGKGTLLSNFDVPTPRAWPQQSLEPLYEWNNAYDGANADMLAQDAESALAIVEGRDFFKDAAKPNYTPYVYPHPLTAAP
jgi:hypothetical protein